MPSRRWSRTGTEGVEPGFLRSYDLTGRAGMAPTRLPALGGGVYSACPQWRRLWGSCLLASRALSRDFSRIPGGARRGPRSSALMVPLTEGIASKIIYAEGAIFQWGQNLSFHPSPYQSHAHSKKSRTFKSTDFEFYCK